MSLLAVSSAAQTPLPPSEPLLAGDALTAFAPQVAPAARDRADVTVVDSAGPGFTRAWRVATRQDASPAAAIELRAVSSRAMQGDDVALLRFFARATEISDETGGARIGVVVHGKGPDWDSSFEGDFSFSREWQEVLVPFVVNRDFAAGDVAVMLHFGYKRQAVEVGGLEVVYYGHARTLESLPRTRFTYAGREPGAAWRREALARIERLRKSDFALTVVDAAGHPVPGAKVAIEERRSAFQWGVALQMGRLVVDSPDNLRYRRVAEELFNAASTENDLKWPTWIGEWGDDFSQAQTLAGLRWLRAHAFHVRGHVLVWPGRKNLPAIVTDWIGTPRQDEIPGLVIDHIREITRATKGLVDEWDVLNEPFTNHELMDIFGREIMPTWFKAAREELPGVPLFFNDFSNQDRSTDADHVADFEQTTRYLIDHGAPVDGLGLQAHFGSRPNDPAQILAVLDDYAREFHRPIRFTEFDVWTSDEELQTDFTRDFLILAFSHPAVIGVQHWGFWATNHWRPSAAMFRADWSEKPNARVYRDLVLHQWRTKLDGTLDANGRLSGRGFQGDYVVVVEANGHRVEQRLSLPPSTKPVEWRIVLP